MHFDFVGEPEDVVLPVGVGLCPKVFGSPCRCVKLFSRASPVIHHLVETVTHTLKQGGPHFKLVNQYFDRLRHTCRMSFSSNISMQTFSSFWASPAAASR